MMMMMSQDPNTLPCPQGQGGTGIPITTVGGEVEIVTLTYYGKDAEQTVEHVVSSNVSGGGVSNPVTTASTTTAVKSVPVHIPPLAKSVNCLFCYSHISKFDPGQTKVKVNSKRMMVKTSERLFQYICQHLEIDSSSLFNQSNQQLQLRPGNLPLCLGCRSVYYHQIYDAFVAYELAVDNLKKQISGCITNAIAKSVQGHELSLNHQVPDTLGNEHDVMTLVKQFRRKIIQKNPSASNQNQANSTNVVNTNTTLLQPVTAAAIDPKSVPVPIPSSNVEVVAHSSTGYKNVINLVKANVVQGVGATRIMDATGSKILQCYGVSNLPPGVIQIVPINANSLDPSLWQHQPPPPPVSQIKREPEYKEPRAQPNACKYCNQVFPADPLALTRHMVREHGMEKPEKCPQCDFRCCEKSSLVRHMKIHLDDKERSKPYRCNECGKEYMGQSHLKSHMETHAGTRQLYNCDVCGKQFKNSSSRKHCLDKHNGVKKYQCTYCDKRFFRKEVMKSHERTHTGEKPFKCEVCGMCFTRSTSRKKHLKNVHKKIN